MKKLGFAIAGFVAVASAPVFAADLRMPVKARAAAIMAPYNWTGCYIGANVGAGWAQTEQTQIAKVAPPIPIIPPNDFGTSDGSSLIAGGQIGCDYQMGSWVFGVQGMFDFGHIDSTHAVPTAFPGFPVGAFVSQNQTRNIFTATGRVGYLFATQVLAYVKGGGAWTRVDHTFLGTIPVTFLSENALGVDRQGWTVGGGLEWMFAPGWSLFGEYSYMDFGSRDISFVRGPLAVVGSEDVVRTRLTVQQVLVGVNYKFNWGGPVVAAY